VSKKLSERHLKQLSYHEKQLTMTMEELIVIRKTMQDNTYLRYTFSAANTYVDFQEFQDLFANHHILYLSHAREYFPHL
jgi:radical SAM superfamily enzyme